MKKAKGFTLIEMLVAMAIFASLISTLMLGFQQGLLLWEKSQKQSHYWLQSEFRYGLLSTLFSQAIIANNQYKQGLFASYFIGTVTNITFISSAPIMDINGRVHPIEIQAIQDKKNWTLRYREGARYSDLGRGIKWSNPWIELLTQLKKVKFTYLAPAFPLPVELDPRWLDDDEKLRYRDVPTWVSHYDCRQRGLYPTQIAIKFTDKQDIEHQWLFSPPTASDAWSMGFYETD